MVSETTAVWPVVVNKAACWRAEDVLVVEAENLADYMVNLRVTFLGGEKRVVVRIGVFPHWPVRLALPLEAMTGNTLFLERTPGCFKSVVNGANLTLEELERITIESSPGGEADVRILDVRISPTMPTEWLLPDHPLVDELHQWRDRDWPGKAASLDEVRATLAAELTAEMPTFPDEWSAYGGWMGKRFAATGFFRTEHDGRRWWLVDPEGCAFWSIGVDCIRPEVGVNTRGIASVFDPPLPTPEEAPQLWSPQQPQLFSCIQHNLERTLGTEWKTEWLELTRRRLTRLRINTIANWSDPDVYATCRLPYVFTMTGFPGTQTMLFRDFPDVFSAEYAENCARFAEQLAEKRDDPHMIGYFMTNEPKWAFFQHFDLGVQVLRDAQPSTCRARFIERLREQYGTVDALNDAWSATFDSFDDLHHPVEEAVLLRGKADTLDFTREAVEAYVRIPTRACRAVDPNHCNMGLRWAGIHNAYQLAGADELDIFSINCYQVKPDPEYIGKLVAMTGKPLMIGEFHIGALDRGLPSAGIRNARTMAESVQAYRYYIENAAALPGLVGAHYFQWSDQHVMGRHDGENMQIGLHDITYRPYAEWVEICRQTHPGIYPIAAGEATPTDECPETVPQGTLCW